MKKIVFTLIAIISFLNQDLLATHFRAAEMFAERLGGLSFRITVITYTDFNNVADGIGDIPADEITIGIGPDVNNPVDLIENVPRSSVREIVPGTTFENVYVTEYTFQPVGGFGLIWYSDFNRNAGIRNISNSLIESIYIETAVSLDPFDVVNSTPQFTAPPIDIGAVNRVYTHNPGGFDVDGDSLVYELIPPRNASGQTVNGFVPPDDPRFGAGSVFSIDARTGQITWDTPLLEGEYNIAYRVLEFEDNGVFKGSVVRDMQILVEDTENTPPVLVLPEDTTIAVNSNALFRVSVFDEESSFFEADLFGGIAQSESSIVNIENTIDSTFITVSFMPSCRDVGKTISSVIRVEDAGNFPGISLSTTGAWFINVEVNQPVLEASLNADNTIQLNWEAIDCQDIFSSVSVLRALCTSENTTDFEEIAQVSIESTSFIDETALDDNLYSYIVVANNFLGEDPLLSTSSSVFTGTNPDNLSVCDHSDDPLITALEPVEADNEVSIEIYPNPASEEIWVKNNKGYQADFNLFDINGQLIFTTSIDSELVPIILNDLETGTYFYEVNTAQKNLEKGSLIIK